jgi:hypothetical protein
MISGHLELISNPSLASIGRLDELEHIAGSVRIVRNPTLTDLSSMDALASTGGDLIIYDNASLTSLEGLEGMTSIGGSLVIVGNTSMAGVGCLNALSTIHGRIEISNNANINCLAGLDNVDAASVTRLSMVNNYLLSECNVQSICDYLAVPGAVVEIYNNAPGCNSPEEVESTCVAVGVEDFGLNRILIIYPNPSMGSIFIETPEITGDKILEILNISGQQLLNQTMPGISCRIDVSKLPTGPLCCES